MPEQLQKIIQPVKSRWDALAKDQKIKLAAAIAVILIAFGVFLYFMLRIEYEGFISGREPIEIMDIEALLNDEGIANRVVNNSTAIEVDKKQKGKAKMVFESSSIVTGDNFTYTDALDFSGMGTTQDVMRQNFIKAHETSLGTELTLFDGVISAAVDLTIPEALRLFISDTEESRARVTLNVSRELNQNEGRALAGHIAMSVEGLKMENVHILDQNYNVVYSGMEEEAARSVEGSVAEIKTMENTAVANKIQNAYSRMFHDVVVIPNLVYNEIALTEQVREEYFLPDDAETGLPLTEIMSDFEGENVAPESAPGTDTNNAEETTYQSGGSSNSSFEQRNSEVTRGYNKVITTETQGPGSYIRNSSSIALYLYRFVTHYQEQYMRDNPNATAVDWEAFMSNTPGENVSANEPLEQYRQEISSATGIPVENITVSVWQLPAYVPYDEPEIDIPLIIALCLLGLLLLMLAYALIRRQKLEEDEEETEPELSVEDLLVSTQLEEAKEDAEKLEEIDYAKESEIKKQIEKFVNEKPEAVAALLRNWLNTEDW